MSGMVWVTPVHSFEHYGTRRRGVAFKVSRQVADRLKARGLVTVNGEADEDPGLPVGQAQPSSASPAGQASQPMTSDTSSDGDEPEPELEPEPRFRLRKRRGG